MITMLLSGKQMIKHKLRGTLSMRGALSRAPTYCKILSDADGRQVPGEHH